METYSREWRLKLVVWRLGFRPFFLLAVFSAMIFMSLWLGFLLGIFPQIGFLPAVTWHAHEMIYGFSVAVVAGFILTAIQNWTGIPGVKDARLIFLCALWILGRLSVLIFPEPHVLALILGLSFYPAVSCFLLPYYIKDRELVFERVFFLFFLLLMLGDAAVYLDALGVLPGWGRTGLLLGMNTILVMIVFMGGRVIPFFTEGTLTRRQPRTFKSIEILSALTAWAFLLTNTWVFSVWVAGGIAWVAGIVHAIRWGGWQVRRVRRVPLIWVLHLSYLWIVVGYFLSGLSFVGWIPQATAYHAFTVGGIGMVTFGMMSRVSLGHTGRRLHPSPVTVAGYVLILLAAVVRVFFGWAMGSSWGWPSSVSAALWILGFFLLAWVYTPILIAPRVDGRKG